MRLVIDGNEANVTHRVGSNVYAFELLRQLAELTRETHTVTVVLTDPPVADLPAERPGWRYQIVTPRPLWTQWGLSLYLFQHRREFDVLFTPGHYAPRLSSIPYVSSVMDLGFLHFPEQFRKKDLWQLTNWTAYSVKRASKVIAISQATKKDVVDHYGKSASDIVVAYPAAEVQKPEAQVRVRRVLRDYGLAAPYIVYVGTLQPRKNLVKLVEGFEILCQKSVAKKMAWRPTGDGRALQVLPQLVLAGKVGWLADPIQARIDSSPFKSQIIQTGFVDDVVKKALYQGAHASVLVGLYEGFGIPPLESLQLGTIPVVANATSLPEVVGKAGILVDPQDVTSIAAGLERALTMPPRQYQEWQKLASKQVAKFNWRDSATTILETLQEVGSK